MLPEIIPALLPRPTLFIHGNLASSRWWQPTIAHLRAQAKKRAAAGQAPFSGPAILADWRGCGRALHPESEKDYKFPTLAGDYLRLLEGLSHGPVDVVGHSTGGLIALQAMAMAPQRFGRGVFLDSVSPNGRIFDATLLAMFRKMSQDKAYCREVLFHALYANRPDNADLALENAIVDDAFSVSPHVWLGVPRMLAEAALVPEARQLSHPILLLHGSKDPIIPLSHSEEFAEILRKGFLKVFSGLGHSANIESPALFTAELSLFLEK